MLNVHQRQIRHNAIISMEDLHVDRDDSLRAGSISRQGSDLALSFFPGMVHIQEFLVERFNMDLDIELCLKLYL